MRVGERVCARMIFEETYLVQRKYVVPDTLVHLDVRGYVRCNSVVVQSISAWVCACCVCGVGVGGCVRVCMRVVRVFGCGWVVM